MPKTIKKILCYTAITSILNLSFQPAYAGKSDLPFASEEISYTQKVSHHLSKKDIYTEKMSDPGLEDLQANSTRTSQTIEADTVSMFLLTPLKTMMGAVSLVKQGVRFALENPGQAIVIGLLFQARTVTSTLSLSGLTPNQGFTITGAAAGDDSGVSVSSAGDFNGDGLCDIVIGAPYANSHMGKSYVIYGTKTPPSSISLSSLAPLQGFAITGAAVNDESGWSVSSAGDFNGDGLYDLIIGADKANSYVGDSYVIYGTKIPPNSISLSSLIPNQGFTISGAAAGGYSGFSVSSAGDFNGDGLGDIIIGAPYANSYVGNSYVIYGTKTPPSSISLGSLTSNQGFTISGAVANDRSGYSVSSAGDFNGDGLSDVIIGAFQANSNAGNSYVIYGTKTPPSSISLGSLTPNQGFAIYGAAAWDESGWSVSSAGDFNGDGFNDVIIGALGANSYAGNSYVIYGTKTPPSSISLGSLISNQGFTISGAVANDRSGYSVSSAGDFNDDGLDDVVIGAPGANGNAGNSYVIYGTNSTPSSISLGSLTPLQGFTITGAARLDLSGASVSSAGDFNDDGFNDVIIGALGANGNTGKSYVIYGALAHSPASTSMMTSGGIGTSTTIPTSRMTSTNPPTYPVSTTLNPTSEPRSSRMPSSSSIPPSNPPFSPPVQHSSNENSKGMSWETIAAISGGVGGAFVAGVVGTIVVKKCCFSNRNKSGYSRLKPIEEDA